MGSQRFSERGAYGGRVGVLPGGVVYLLPAVITEKNTAGEIATGEALGAVGVCSVRE
jgi:hypothetical protein